jgi:hypothetical protein
MNRIKLAVPPSPPGCGQGDEEQEERHRKSVIETGFHVEGLADAQRHARAVHDVLSEAGVGRCENGSEDSRFPDRHVRKHEERRDGAEHDGQQHARAQQAHRQASNVPQYVQIGAAGIGEEQQYQADFGKTKEDIAADSRAEHRGRDRAHQHARGGEYDGRRDDRLFQPRTRGCSKTAARRTRRAAPLPPAPFARRPGVFRFVSISRPRISCP